MKLIIQIPCFNEAETLPLVFEKMPRSLPGIDVIEYQIIDDGSEDDTVRIARTLGVQHIVRYRGHNRRWLGRAFKMGADHALKMGADILVNTDGDNQYPSDQIGRLIAPILENRAEIVIGDRSPGEYKEFSPFKRFLQRLGSWTTQLAAGGHVPDAVSGFRAYSREALAMLNVVTDYTYTVDTLMQAHKKGIDVAWVKINVNAKTRDSRLIANLWSKIKKSGATILRMYTLYEPFKTFLYLSLVALLPGLFLIGRFLFHYLTDSGRSDGLVQSLLIGVALAIIGTQMMSLGIIADLIKVNRKLIEDILAKQKLGDGKHDGD